MLIRPKPSGKRLEPPTLQDEVDALLRRYTRTDISRALRNSTAPKQHGQRDYQRPTRRDVRRAHQLVEVKRRGRASISRACDWLVAEWKAVAESDRDRLMRVVLERRKPAQYLRSLYYEAVED
jgi:hypothetical protein